MLSLFSENLLPVFLAAGAGYLVAARFQLDPRPLARIAFFVFAPCLIFDAIVRNNLPAEALARMVGFALASLISVGALAGLVARGLGLSRAMTAAIILVVLLPNAGNFGLSVSLFAFDEPGLAQASVFFVTSAILTFTVGVFVASLGRASVGAALFGLLRVPTIWAVAVALVSLRTGWGLPFPVERTVDLFADASIPSFLVILGMQLHGHGLSGPARPLMVAVGMRLICGCAAGLLLASVFSLAGPARQAGILQAAMPSAVICIVIATEYEVEPAFVTSVVFLTTLLSPLTLTPLLSFLGA
jgi:predicted permease